MVITAETIKNLISALGFVPVDGEAEIFNKKYAQHDGYVLRVNFANKTIEYADSTFGESARITVGNKSTSNFLKPENFVVLECIDRLLEKGYSPNSIELEKNYPSGGGRSGNLDILVNDVDGRAFLMIECKTWGKEYTKEIAKMLASGGQLFTYFKNATSAKSLCLYTSRFVGNKVEYENSIVDVSEDWKALSETKDIHERWNKIFKKNGIFEEYASPYNIVHKRLTYGDLVTMKDEDSKKIFHQIMTILRHNGVSDKPNAFNKLLNLFVCKIIDEDRNTDEELQFQSWEGLSDEDLQMTLNELYKKGMNRFLNIKIFTLTKSDVDNIIYRSEVGNEEENRKQLIDQILKTNPNFAFVEVLDNKTFELNAKIVREVVELLQHYKFRYEQKHEFLGDFFEKMLNTSMKQEAGQFFTPVPITRFIISSLPLRNFVQEKINEKNPDPLPTIIDYACGSGHFLTEYMSTMQKIIETVDIDSASPRTRGKLNSWRGDVKFEWADEYVYGIDFDNRLVKTAKVSAFFNGDGEATIIWGDGLDSFEHSEVYRGKLKETMQNKQNNGQFDILISNPPYSVEAFRRMLRHGAESFSLYDGLTDNSSEIECLFIERMKQLLKIGGWAGVILPSSMLTNSGIYARARDIIFKYFNVKAIVELGSSTFMETGTNTVILFLERRSDNDHEKIVQAINTFFINKNDVTVLGIERAFSAYVVNVYDDLSYEDYLSFVNENPNDTMRNHELYKDHVKEFGDVPYSKAFEVEKEKMLYFLLTYNQNIVVAKSGQKQDEKAFLGYDFSKRRGNEGIKLLPSGTMLYDENNITNTQKINSYIFNAYLGKANIQVNVAVANHVSYGCMSSYFEYGTSKFIKRVNLRKIGRIASKWAQVTLSDVLTTLESGNRPSGGVSAITDGSISIGGEHIGLDGKLDLSNLRFVPHKFFQDSKLGKVLPNDILICKDGALTGKVCIIPEMLPYDEMMINEHVFILRANEKALQKYLFAVLFSEQGQALLRSNVTGQAQGGLNSTNLRNIKIPLPTIEVQEQIVTEFESIKKEIDGIKSNIDKAHQSIETKFLDLFGDPVSNPKKWDVKRLGDCGAFKNGMNYSKKDRGFVIKCLSVGDFGNCYKIDDLTKLSYINLSSEPTQDYILKDGDIVFVRSNGNKDLIGRSVEMFTHGEKLTFSGFCIRYRLSFDGILSTYLNHAFHVPTFRAKLIQSGSGANINNLNQQMLSALQIPVPTINMQHNFINFICSIEEDIKIYQQTLDEKLKKREEIFVKYL